MHPLVETMRSLSEDDGVELVFAQRSWPPPGEDWTVLSDVLDNPAVVEGWVQDLLAGEARGRRDVAGSYLASWLAGTVAGVAAGSLIAMGRTWPLDPAGMAVHRHPDGWFDKTALNRPTLWVEAGDPAAGHPDAVVFENLNELYVRLAGEVVRLIEPVFSAVRAATRYPTRSMWGALSDGIAGSAVWRGLRKGTSDPGDWDRAMEFLDRLEERTRLVRTRPRLAEVVWSGGVARLSVKGTCCLYFKVFDGEPDPCGEGYCSSCPFRTDESRQQKWSTWLEERELA
jgi:hypothetical protein